MISWFGYNKRKNGGRKMKFSTKSRYGLIALTDLAVNSKNGHISLASIAERNHISSLYLEQVFASLKRGGIVKSVKGPQGGYQLNHAPKDIPISQILEILEGTYHISDEQDMENLFSQSIQTIVIDKINQEMDRVLENMTLEDLEQEYTRRSSVSDMYYI